MTTPRLGVGVASLGGYLYAVGGSDGDTPLASAERWVRAMHAMAYIVAALVYIHTYMHTCTRTYRYDPAKDEWSVVCPMTVPRKHLGAAVLDGLLFAVGGRNQATELSSVEK